MNKLFFHLAVDLKLSIAVLSAEAPYSFRTYHLNKARYHSIIKRRASAT